MMRVLHVFDTAGVASLLVEALKDNGVEANLIVRKRHRARFPNEKVVKGNTLMFLAYVLRASFKYNIMHIHGLPYRRLFNIDILLLKIFRRKVVVHLHGSEIRDPNYKRAHNKISIRLALRLADEVLVSTPDLLSYAKVGTWLPNPIDPKFKVLNNQKSGTLYFKKDYGNKFAKFIHEDNEFARHIYKHLNLEPPLVEKIPDVPYEQLPAFLNAFKYFIDDMLPAFSKTALEAMACGCKVVNWEGKIVNSSKILRQHKVSNVFHRLLSVYEGVIK